MAGEGDNGVHGPLAKAARARQNGAVVVLQGARHDLRCRGRAAIYQHHHGQAIGNVCSMGIPALAVLGVACAGGDNLARADKAGGYLHRLIKQATGVITQVKHQPAQLATGLLLEGVVALEQFFFRGFVELGNPQVANPVVQGGFDHINMDDLARQGDRNGLGCFFTHKGQGNFGVGLAPHSLDRFVQRGAVYCVPIHGNNVIARLDPRAKARCAINGGDNADMAILLLQLQTQAAKFALHLDHHVVILFLRHV